MPSYGGYVYILADTDYKRLFVGYTSDLITRISEYIHEKHGEAAALQRVQGTALRLNKKRLNRHRLSLFTAWISK